MSKSNLSFCENFNDKNDLSTFRWLTKIEWKITKNVTNDEISSKTFLKIIYLLITENAIVWTESNQQTAEILIKRNPTQKNVNTFYDLFQARFSTRTYEINFENYNQELKNFHQAKDESLLNYYSRMKALIHKMNVKKKSSLSETTFLNYIDLMILNTIFRIFLKDLNDADIKRETTKNMRSSEKSLRSLYLLIEKIKIIKVELKKLKKEEKKIKKFQLYKNYANDLLDKSKLTALLFEFTLSTDANWKSFITSSTHENIINVFRLNNNRLLYQSNRRSQSRSEANNYRRFNENYKLFINKQSDLFNFNQSVSKSLSNRKTSENSYINDEKIWSSADEPLCVKCEKVDSKSNEKHQCLLFSAWEKSYFRSIVFEDSAQASFVFYNYEQYDENLKSYDHHISHKMIMSRFESETFSENFRIFIPEFTVSFFDYSASNYASKSVFLSFFFEFLESVSSIESFYDEKSSKRSHMNDSSQSTQSTLQDERMSQFSSSNERVTKKEKKRANKKAEMTFLVRMFNETLKSYDKTISIKDVLKEVKIDLTWMNFLIWSFVICRKLKRMCIRVAKKRFSKFKSTSDRSMSLFQSFPSNLSNFQWMSIQIVRSQQPQDYFTIEISQMSASSVIQQSVSLQSYQSQRQSQQMSSLNSDQQDQQVQINMKSSIQEILKTVMKKNVSFAESESDDRINFLKKLIKLEKAFRFSTTVILDTIRVMLKKEYTQTDQDSEMNVISSEMIRKLNLIRVIRNIRISCTSPIPGTSLDTTFPESWYHLPWIMISSLLDHDILIPPSLDHDHDIVSA